MQGLPIFVINLDVATERLSFMQGQAAKADIAFERIAGVRGTQVPENLRDQFLNADGTPRSSLSAGEIGCYASHLEAARLIVARDLPAALVLEDDVELRGDLKSFLTQIAGVLPDAWDIVKLCNYHHRTVYCVRRFGDSHLVRFYRQPALAAGYLLSRQGAAKLLAPQPRIRPIDIEMRQPWHMDLDIYGVCPPPVKQLSFLRSYIKNESDFEPARGYGQFQYETFKYAVRHMGLWQALACRAVDAVYRRQTRPPRETGLWIPYSRVRKGHTISDRPPTGAP